LIGSIPSELGKLKELEGLFLWENSLTGIVVISNLNYYVVGYDIVLI
jgi:hypothetical protein